MVSSREQLGTLVAGSEPVEDYAFDPFGRGVVQRPEGLSELYCVDIIFTKTKLKPYNKWSISS